MTAIALRADRGLWRLPRSAPGAALGIALLLVGRTISAEGPRFEDATAAAKIAFEHRSPLSEERHVHLTMGSGVAWIDFDRDGRPDVYFAQGSDWPPTSRESSRLHRNRGDGTFADVTEAAGLVDPFYAMGLAAGDYDGDGFADLYVSGFGMNRCYRNNGDGTFADVAQALQVDHAGYGSSCTWGDIDGDGLLDLFVVNYLAIDPQKYPLCSRDVDGRRLYFACHPQRVSPQYDVLYRNEGDGTFADVTESAGLRRDPARQGLGIAAADLDGDGDLDFYVANDTVPNQLWENQGTGTFADAGFLSNTALNRHGVAEAGMGVAVGDVNGDGRFDLFVTNYYAETNTLYRNEGGLGFLDVTDEMGLAAPSRLRLGFGTSLADFENDGWLDLFVANGHVHDRLKLFGRDEPYAQPAQLFRNERGRRFADVSSQAGEYFGREVVGRGSAAADYDGDGRIDLAVQHLNSPAALLRNTTEPAGSALRIELVGVESNRDGIGAVVEVQAAGRVLTRLRPGSTSYLSCDEARLTIGVGDAEVAERVTVTWPSGRREAWDELSTGRVHCLVEGTGSGVEN